MRIKIILKCRLFEELLYSFFLNDKDIKPLLDSEKEEEPDIVLISMHGLTDEICEKYSNSKIVLLDTGLKKEEIVSALIKYKLKGIISADTDIALFKKALKVIKSGEIWISKKLIELLINNENIQKNGNIHITDKEYSIISLVCEGLSNKEIASRLYVSEQTVKAHLNRIFKKLNISHRYQLFSLFLKK